ncbi:small integral membrane protein 3 isoform X1 [Rhinoderma darwinii]|uniref:small integral membrane protein 3 isoform X1 n=2 Tax=Rhinoderma darwinii TaxID=43563 RepID=UPI003F66C87D
MTLVSTPQAAMNDLVTPTPLEIPKHILDIWVIILIILATILVMTSLLLFPAAAVIMYRVRTHPIRSSR